MEKELVVLDGRDMGDGYITSLKLVFSLIKEDKATWFGILCACKTWNKVISQMIDPSYMVDQALILSVERGNIAAVRHLLSYPKVDPTCRKYEAYEIALRFGHRKIFQELVQSPRIDPRKLIGKVCLASMMMSEYDNVLVIFNAILKYVKKHRELASAHEKSYRERDSKITFSKQLPKDLYPIYKLCKLINTIDSRQTYPSSLYVIRKVFPIEVIPFPFENATWMTRPFNDSELFSNSQKINIMTYYSDRFEKFKKTITVERMLSTVSTSKQVTGIDWMVASVKDQLDEKDFKILDQFNNELDSVYSMEYIKGFSEPHRTINRISFVQEMLENLKNNPEQIVRPHALREMLICDQSSTIVNYLSKLDIETAIKLLIKMHDQGLVIRLMSLNKCEREKFGRLENCDSMLKLKGNDARSMVEWKFKLDLSKEYVSLFNVAKQHNQMDIIEYMLKNAQIGFDRELELFQGLIDTKYPEMFVALSKYISYGCNFSLVYQLIYTGTCQDEILRVLLELLEKRIDIKYTSQFEDLFLRNAIEHNSDNPKRMEKSLLCFKCFIRKLDKIDNIEGMLDSLASEEPRGHHEEMLQKFAKVYFDEIERRTGKKSPIDSYFLSLKKLMERERHQDAMLKRKKTKKATPSKKQKKM